MLTNALCKSFQRLGVTAKGTILARYCSTNASQIVRNCPPSAIYKPSILSDRSIYEPQLRLSSVRSVNLDLDLPNRSNVITEIGKLPFDEKFRIGEPPKIQRRSEDAPPEKSFDLPSNVAVIEKRAERMIVIRRRKMRKHKLKKLKKRMRFLWAKLRQRRELKKEKAFIAELMTAIQKAEDFDAKEYVESRLAILDNVRIPSRWQGELLPEAQIRQFMEERRQRILKKLNKPRLTL